MEENYRVLSPQYIKKFKCKSSACENGCCDYLEALISDDLNFKFNKIAKVEIKAHIEENLIKIPFNVDYESCAKVKKGENGSCNLLESDGLCYLHKNLGIEYLPENCKNYPRVYNIIDGKVEVSGSFTCIEAVNLALLNKQVMEFDEEDIAFNYNHHIKTQFNTRDNRYSNKVHRYFWPLRIFSIGVLQNRDYKLWERIAILGLFYKRLQTNIDSGAIDATSGLIQEYNKFIEEGIFREKLKVVRPKLDQQVLLIKRINEMKVIKVPKFEKYMNEFDEGLQYSGSNNFQEVVKWYKEAYENYYEPFVSDKEYILENLLINYVFINTFPISQEYDVFDNYINLVVYYAGIKGLLVGIASNKKEINETLIIDVVSCFSRVMEQDKVLHYRIQGDFKESGNNTIGFMTAILKN